MKNIKPYVFNGIECYDLNSLAEEYIKDFFGGMEDIFTNSKALLAFVKRCRRDKEFTLEIANYLYSSKYKNNALTFIIFAFTGYGRVLINGEEMTFRGFVEFFSANKEPGNALYAFLEDGGISKTFAILENDEKLKRDALAIEKSFDNEFTRSFIEGYYDYKSLDGFKNKFDNIIVGNEECFRRATKLSRSLEFQLAIAHKIGFKEALNIHSEVNPLFEAVKVLKSTNDFEDEALFKLIEDTFYWWLLDNVEKYQPKGKEAKSLYSNILDAKKRCNKYRSLIKSKKIYDVSVEEMADLSKEIYLYYLDFVTLYRQDQIVLRKKFNSYAYVFDKPYCNTFIPQAFMEGRVIKVHKKADEGEGRRINVLTGEEIDEELLDESVLIDDAPKEDNTLVSEPKPVDLKKLRRKINRCSRFTGFGGFLLALILVLISVCIALEVTGTVTIFNFKQIYENNVIMGIGAVGAIALIPLLAILGYKNKKAFNAIINLEFIDSARNEVSLNANQEAKLNELLKRSERDNKQAKASSLVLSSICAALIALLVAVAVLFLVPVLAHYPELKLDLTEKLLTNSPLIGVVTSLAIGLALGLVKKYKGILWLCLICLASIAGMLLVLFFI